MNWESVLKIKIKTNLSRAMKDDIDYIVARLMKEPTMLEKVKKILSLEEEE